MAVFLPPNISRPSRRKVLFSILRVLGLLVLLVTGYFVVPVSPNGEAGNWAFLAVGLVLFGLLLAWQVTAVYHSPRPVGRALEALCICLSLYLTMFATQYLAESLENGAAFTQPLDKLAALYFTVTVFATVGFGDIAPVSDVARTITTAQMIINLVVLGLGVRLLAGLAQDRLRAQSAEASAVGPSEASGQTSSSA